MIGDEGAESREGGFLFFYYYFFSSQGELLMGETNCPPPLA